MIMDMIFGMVGGLGFFLFGMDLLSGGLKKVAGQKVRQLLAAFTKHRVIAVLVGAGTTCLIQSSSATTVMTVGFVNAGLMTLKQALCVVLGANIGTTFTAWLVASFSVFKITTYALPAVGIGFLLSILGKTQKARSIGQIMLGFGVLFIGIHFMKEAFGPLKESERAREALVWLGQNPLLAVLAGTAITMLLQSSSASIMMIQLLAFQGAFGTDWDVALKVAIPFILGDNIGTTITAQIAAFRGSVTARRTAMGHTLFNVIGVLYMLPLLVWTDWFSSLVKLVMPGALAQGTIMVHIAVAHSIFNVFNTMLFLPIISWLEVIVTRIVHPRASDAIIKRVVLEEHLLNTPEIAIDQVRREIVRMVAVARDAINQAIEGLCEDDRHKLALSRKTEEMTDDFQYEITSYLVNLSTRGLSDEVSMILPVMLHTVNDLERVGDHAVNIAEVAERKIEQKILFTDSAKVESGQLTDEVNEMFDHVSNALENDNAAAARSALINEEHLNRMQMTFRRSHVERMTDGECSPQSGLIFIDLVDNVEKVGDHLTNIAQAVIGGLQWDGIEQKSVKTG